MEIVIAVFLGVWVTVCSLLAFIRVRKDLRGGTESGKRNK